MNSNKLNTVQLIGFYGGDTTHAASAWTSTIRDINPEKMKRVGPLLKMLAENGHHTPFEKSSLHFLAVTDISTHIQLLKHRIGVSLNGESARYKELKDDKYYVPVDWPEAEQQIYIEHMERSLKGYHECLDRLIKQGFSRRRAKESARMYLPYGNQLTVDVMFNWRSFMHFAGLRYATDAQLEIKNLASEMLELVKNIEGEPFVQSLKAFNMLDADGNLLPAVQKL
jgi:thymidylate synthase (FAD)